jgi:hypothetical protein
VRTHQTFVLSRASRAASPRIASPRRKPMMTPALEALSPSETWAYDAGEEQGRNEHDRHQTQRDVLLREPAVAEDLSPADVAALGRRTRTVPQATQTAVDDPLQALGQGGESRPGAQLTQVVLRVRLTARLTVAHLAGRPPIQHPRALGLGL